MKRPEKYPAVNYSLFITRGVSYEAVSAWWRSLPYSWTFDKAWNTWNDGEAMLWVALQARPINQRIRLVTSYLLRVLEDEVDDPYFSVFVTEFEGFTQAPSPWKRQELKRWIPVDDPDLHWEAARFGVRYGNNPLIAQTVLAYARHLVKNEVLADVVRRALPSSYIAPLLARPIQKTIRTSPAKVIHLR